MEDKMATEELIEKFMPKKKKSNRKFIGLIWWNDGSGVLDNTIIGGFQSVWKELCLAHPLHAGRMAIFNAKGINEDGNIDGYPVKEFVGVEDCRVRYVKQFDEEPPHRCCGR